MDTTWQWVSSAVTDVGNVRKINEDAILDRPQQGLWVVADGMGGHEAGDVASSSIVSALSSLGSYDKPSEFVNAVEDTLISVNNLAVLLHLQGRLAEAEPHYREALDGFGEIALEFVDDFAR